MSVVIAVVGAALVAFLHLRIMGAWMPAKVITSMAVPTGKRASATPSELVRWLGTPMWIFARALGGKTLTFNDLLYLPLWCKGEVSFGLAAVVVSWCLLPVMAPMAAFWCVVDAFKDDE